MNTHYWAACWYSSKQTEVFMNSPQKRKKSQCFRKEYCWELMTIDFFSRKSSPTPPNQSSDLKLFSLFLHYLRKNNKTFR